MGKWKSSVEKLVMDLNFWKNKTIFLTGNTGFKGSWLTMILLKLNANVVGYSLTAPTAPSLFLESKLDNKIKTFYNDIRDYSNLEKAIKSVKPDIIIHAAAQSLVSEGYDDPLNTYSTNIMGTVNILEILRKLNDTNLLINVTSDKCYMNNDLKQAFVETDSMGGKDPYSSSKGCSEIITNAYQNSFFQNTEKNLNVSLASVRAGNVIGGGDWAKNRLVPDILDSYKNKQELCIRNLNSTRPWQHVLDPLFGYLKLIEKLYNDKAYSGGWNFGPNSTNEISVMQLVNSFENSLNYKFKKNILKENFITESNFLKLDTSKASKKLKWSPKITFDDSVNLISEWFLNWLEDGNAEKITNDQIDFFLEKD